MKVLISGVTGRVGANLAHQLMERGYFVRGLVMPGDPKANKAANLGVEIVEADIADADRVRAAADGVNIVIHQAAQILEGIYPSERMLAINTQSTVSLLEGALASSTPVKRFILASTDQTYQPFVTHQVTFYEDSPQQPADIYALTKLLSENACRAYMAEYGIPVTILRYSSILAANEVLGVLNPVWLKYFVDLAVAKNRIPWFGSQHVDEAQAIIQDLLETPDAVCAVTDPKGKSWALAFTDVRDVVAGTLLALDSDNAVGEAFNMVSPVPVSYTTAARLIADNTERPYRDVAMPFYWGPHVSNEKARSMLGYKPQYSFDKMVETALAFQRGDAINQIPN